MIETLSLDANRAVQAGVAGDPELRQWVAAHGVDVNDVVYFRVVHNPVEGWQVQFDRLARNAAGGRYVDPETGAAARRPRLTVPLVAPVPEVVRKACANVVT